jgi:ketosteroid isomerase-like protein
MECAKLVHLTRRFTDAFNRNDLDAVMAFFSDDGVYDEFNGKRNRGKAVIGAAFERHFSGAFGYMEFREDDIFVDAEAGKAMISLRYTLSVSGKPTSWRGLDLLRFVGECIVSKRTYAKARAPLFEDQLDRRPRMTGPLLIS